MPPNKNRRSVKLARNEILVAERDLSSSMQTFRSGSSDDRFLEDLMTGLAASILRADRNSVDAMPEAHQAESCWTCL